MIEAANERLNNAPQHQQIRAWILKADFVAATKKMEAESLTLADDAMNVVHTLALTGQLGEVIEIVDEGLDVEARDEDAPLFEMLVREPQGDRA
jgi:hypothetical protein